MKRTSVLLVCLWACSAVFATAQPSEPLKPSDYTFRLARLLLKNGTVKEGWFLGTVRDSIVLQVGLRSHRYARQDLVRVDVNGDRSPGKSTLAGMALGMYAGNALFLTADHQPTLFFGRGTHSDSYILLEIAFALIGAGTGYAIGSFQSDYRTFELAGSEEENAARWAELTEEGPDQERSSTLHLSIQGSWVSGPLPEPGEDNVAYVNSRASRLNLLRRVQLTNSVSRFADVGLAAMWLGQPSVWVNEWGWNYQSTRSQELTGRGYYAVGMFQPLWKLGLRGVQWDIGGGVGIATIDCRSASQVYDYSSGSWSEVAVKLQKSTISAALITELKVFLGDNLSLGVAADLAYIPEDVPDAQGFSFRSKTVGTSSIGFVVGFHL